MIQVSNAGTVCLRGAVHRLGQRRDGGLPQLCSREGGASDPDEMDGACGHGTHEVLSGISELGQVADGVGCRRDEGPKKLGPPNLTRTAALSTSTTSPPRFRDQVAESKSPDA